MSDLMDTEYLYKTFELCPFHRHMSLELEVVEQGTVRVWVRYKPELNQAMGIFHGGVFAATLDAATYYAALSHYGRSDRLPLTQEYKINLLGTAREEDIVATAKLLKAGNTVAVAEAKLHTASGKLVAAGMASFIIPGGR